MRGRLDPDIGYWAERWDPDGRLLPLYYTSHIGSRWVNVTTLPARLLGLPLFRLGGYRLALLVPMLGAVAAAFAAPQALARRLGDGDGWPAFWIVGLASPVAVYALDFWEHTIGLALDGVGDGGAARCRRGAGAPRRHSLPASASASPLRCARKRSSMPRWLPLARARLVLAEQRNNGPWRRAFLLVVGYGRAAPRLTRRSNGRRCYGWVCSSPPL